MKNSYAKKHIYPHRKLSSKKQLGFTIVELLIVIIVIGILAAISVVTYSHISNKARSSATKADLTNIETKLKTYHVQNDRFPASLEEMKADGFGATEKMNWGDWNDEAGTTRGKYRVATSNYNDGNNLGLNVYYWDYDEGGWMRKSFDYTEYSDGSSEWETRANDGFLYTPGVGSPCQAVVLEECSRVLM